MWGGVGWGVQGLLVSEDLQIIKQIQYIRHRPPKNETNPPSKHQLQGSFDPRRMLRKGTLWVMAGYQALVEMEEPGAHSRSEGSGRGGGVALTARVLTRGAGGAAAWR